MSEDMFEMEDEEMEVEDTEDGGAIVTMGEEEEPDDSAMYTEHFTNIIDSVDQGMLGDVISDLITKIEQDKKARQRRDELYEEGLKRTGLGDDAPGGATFQGATRVVHPLLVEACVDFASRVTKELLPPSGPVKSKIIGIQDSDRLAKSQRKVDFLNWQLTEQMPEFRSEIDQLCTQLPLGGVQYIKLFWNTRQKRPQSEFIAVDDILLPFAATNFYSAERKTHVQYVTEAEFNRRVSDGMYREIKLTTPQDPEYSRASEANDKIEGREDSAYNIDGLRTIFEVYAAFDIGEGVLPYVISIDKSTEEGLALYRNWDPTDEAQRELAWIIEFPFIPWRGAYPIGLTHLIGGLAASSTGALRALLDSAHINNIPGMLKLKGGPTGQTITVQPTEVVEIEGGINIDDVRKIAMPLPFNPPSPVLFQLLGYLVDAGKGVVQTSFDKLADTSQQQPVGTTMALIEQGMAVFSSIHARLHASMGTLLKVLHRINASYLTEEDIEKQLGEVEIEPEDFDGPLDIIPVSDPFIFSETQRFAQMQAVLERSSVNPDMYNLRHVEEMFLRQMRLKPEELLVEIPQQEDRNPVEENVASAMGQPIYVLLDQDHYLHLNIHFSFLQSPLFGQNPMIMKSLLPSMVPHLRDHLLNYYLFESKQVVIKAMQKGTVSDDSREQAQLVVRVQHEIEKQYGSALQMLVQLDQMAKQLAQQNAPTDPALQIAQMNVELQQNLQKMKSQLDQMQLQFEREKLQTTTQFNQMKLQVDSQIERERLQEKATANQLKLVHDAQNKGEDRKAKANMNTADNQTALTIAAMEIESGEKIAVESGNSINPTP